MFEPLPAEIQQKYAEFDRQGFIHRRMQRWVEAAKVYSKSYQLLLGSQPSGQRFHKGGPLHFLGMCYLYQGQKAEALKYFLLAYVEDLLSKAKGQINIAETEAAALALRTLKVEEQILSAIKRVAVEKRTKGIVVSNPEELLAEAIESKGGAAYLRSLSARLPPPAKNRSLAAIDPAWGNRVFVGGNYNNLATLTEIKEAVLEAGDFDPILANEFEMPEELIHHHTLMLLHNCKHAIFDISFEGGHLMEIERLRDYGIRPLVVYSKLPGDPPRPRVSEMVKTIGYKPTAYRDMKELRESVIHYLTGQRKTRK